MKSVRDPQLTKRIHAAKMAPDVAHAFHRALLALAALDGIVGPDEQALIDRLVEVRWGGNDEPAALEALWQVAELFLTACIYVAVSTGEYTIEQAREVSRLASQLGMSARQLSDLERRVMRELARRGAAQIE